jgi:hypothetical protein
MLIAMDKSGGVQGSIWPVEPLDGWDLRPKNLDICVMRKNHQMKCIYSSAYRNYCTGTSRLRTAGGFYNISCLSNKRYFYKSECRVLTDCIIYCVKDALIHTKYLKCVTAVQHMNQSINHVILGPLFCLYETLRNT